MPAPIIVFAYKRADHLAEVLAALAANEGANRSELFIFCDGAKSAKDKADVLAARSVAHGASGFLKISVIEQKENRGLSASILAGVGEICDRYGHAIVLEDDVVPTPYFLGYTNAALDRYKDNEHVFSVGCHTFDAGLDLPETFFLNVPDCWGWAIWQRSWTTFNPDGSRLLSEILKRKEASHFDFDGVYPYTTMLKDQVAGRNQSWAVRLYAHAFLTGKLVLYPKLSVTSNIGFDGTGTHGGANGYTPPRLTNSPISVLPITVEESAIARQAWKAALRVPPRPGLLRRLSAKTGRITRAISHRMQDRS